jgi:WD40 repeat protein
MKIMGRGCRSGRGLRWVEILGRKEQQWGACLQTLEGHSGWVDTVLSSSDDRTVASGLDGSALRLWDAMTGE